MQIYDNSMKPPNKSAKKNRCFQIFSPHPEPDCGTQGQVPVSLHTIYYTLSYSCQSFLKQEPVPLFLRPLVSQAHWAVTPKPYLILILQTPNRYHIHTVLTSVSISTCSRQHHHKRRRFHPRGIYLFCQRFQICCTFLNQPLST